MQASQQAIHHSPGWKGSGIPTIASITKLTAKKLIKSLVRGELRGIKNLLAASYRNARNFVWARPSNPAVQCPCCGWEGSAFIAKSNWRTVTYQAACPSCDSYSRHRGIFALLPRLIEKVRKGDLLFFAPELILLRQLEEHSSELKVLSTDKFNPHVDFPEEDIQDLSFKDSAFAMIICNHVLEHVEDDQKALDQCARVLRSGGIALFTVPGDFTKQETWHFHRLDANGHFRHYGLDLVDKMRNAFDHVEAIDMSSICATNWAVRKHDFAFVCHKH